MTTNASTTLLVDTDGTVRTIRTKQTVGYRPGNHVVTQSVRIEGVDNRTVERPDWYSEAVDATRGNGRLDAVPGPI